MSDDETKKDETTDETSAEETDAAAAGPVAGEDTSSSASSDEAPSPAPPADETSEASAEDAPAPEADSSDAAAAAGQDDTAAAAEDEAPEVEEEEDEEEAGAPAAEEAPAEPDPEDDLPWKQRRRLERSRRPHEAGPQLSPEDRAAQRADHRAHKAAERRKERAAAKAKRDGSGTGTPVAERDSNAAKVRQGIVVSNKGDKSITVRIDFARRHPTYEKIVRRSRTLHAHDERNEAGEGDVVRVVETRPLSKTKRWRLVDVVEKAR
jgi:small subunit ribosomal protein S17